MVSDFDWLKKHIEDILEITYPIENLEPELVNEFGPWSIVKLIAVKYFMNIYTPIIANQEWVDKMRYVELLAGTGLCRVSSNGDLIAGSPIIAAQLARKNFDELNLIDMNSEYCRVLKSRMKNSAVPYVVIEKDCNEGIFDITKKMGDSDHYLAFIDSQKGMEVNWSTMENLLSKPGDLIFNFMSTQVYRAVTAWQKNPEHKSDALDTFYGKDVWKEYQSRDDCLFGYIDKIKAHSSRQIVTPCRITGPGSFYYDLIIATKRTGAGSPYMDAVDELKQRIERLRPNLIEDVLDILKGRRRPLESFFN